MRSTIILLTGASSALAQSRREPQSLVAHVDSRVLARGGVSVRVPRSVFVFVVAVAAHPGAILSAAELGDLLYGHEQDGGPDAATPAIDSLAHRAVPALAALGYRLEASMGRGRSVRCCISPTPVTYSDLNSDLETVHA